MKGRGVESDLYQQPDSECGFSFGNVLSVTLIHSDRSQAFHLLYLIKWAVVESESRGRRIQHGLGSCFTSFIRHCSGCGADPL